MLHCCCMSGRIAIIFVMFPMIDNLFFTGLVLSGRMTTIFVLFSIFDNLCLARVVCLVELCLFLYCYLWLIIYAYWCCMSDRNTTSFVLFFMTDNVCLIGFFMSGRIATIILLLSLIDNWWFTGVVCLVGLRLFL